MRPIIRWTFICFFRAGLAGALAFLVGCSVDGSGAQSSPLQWPGDTWKTATPESQGMSSVLLDQARRYAFAEGRNTQSLLVVYKGVIVGEWYADDCSEVTPATSWSTAKSVVSALIGIAVERGEIANIDSPVATYIPQWQGTDNEVVTIRALLEMRSGFAPIPGGDTLYEQSDQLSASINRELVQPPHTQWSYVNEDSMLLSGIIEAATGKTAAQYARDVLFEPIGMEGEWWSDGSGHTLTYCCIDSTPRHFARFGLLYARGGFWKEREVVPAAWVEESTRALPAAPWYALHWWRSFVHPGMFVSRGYHEQNIYVVPDEDLVVVRNGFYQKLGTGTVREGDTAHYTVGPKTWNDGLLMESILNALLASE